MPPPALTDDLIEEILLRVPPHDPARLVSAALVCKPWCRIATDRGFRRRFREIHRAAPPPVLGVPCNPYRDDGGKTRFVPTSPFRPPRAAGHHRGWRALDARHDRVLFGNSDWDDDPVKDALVVWNPISGKQVELPELPRHGRRSLWCDWNAAVLCAVGVPRTSYPLQWRHLLPPEPPVPTAAGVCDHLDCHNGPFLVVLVGATAWKVFGHVYSSETGKWSMQTTAARIKVDDLAPSLLMGNVLYFKCETSVAILGFDLSTLEMSEIYLPHWKGSARPTVLMATEDGRRLGFATVVDSRLYIWVAEADHEDPGWAHGENERWAQSRVIELETLLPANALSSSPKVVGVVGYADGVGVFFVQTVNGFFSIDLESSQVKKLHDGTDICNVVPYTSICTPTLEPGPGASCGEPRDGDASEKPVAVASSDESGANEASSSSE